MSSDGPVSPGWRLHLLGQPRIARVGGTVARRLSPKDAALLALVALEGPVATEHATALIWPRVERRKADTNLRQRLFRIRRDLGASVVRGGAALQLATDVETDLAATLALVEADPQAGREELLGTLRFEAPSELARWIDAARARWHAERDSVLARVAARCEAEGAVARGLVYAQRLLDSAPLSEHALRRLMRLHYMRGDHSEAIAVFEDFERRLKDELGARPSAETIELLGTIERAAVAVPSPRPVLPASLLRPPCLVGRAVELAALARIWLEHRVFALRGETGIGKTRLLREFAAGYKGTIVVGARPGDTDSPEALLGRLMHAVLGEPPRELPDPLRHALALVLPELGEPVEASDDARPALKRVAIEGALRQAASAGLSAIIIDDLHFADAASMQLLRELIASPTGSGIDWGWARRRTDPDGPAALLEKAFEESRRLVSLELGPLDLEQLRELIESLALPNLDAHRLAPTLLRHTGGSPLFALETLKELVLSRAAGDGAPLPHPASVGALVLRSLAQLSPAALRLARAGALTGSTLSPELAAAVLRLHPLDLAGPWRELEAAQIIRDGGFVHEMMFAVIRTSVPEPIARLLQRRIAEHVRRHPVGPTSEVGTDLASVPRAQATAGSPMHVNGRRPRLP